ncbi:unnamed protein product [Thlaspi arvense]|uniref:Uncharacterized protein n=1 Tax=Thlaspi arvense TaxID=13288 RepID=A0AAU9SW26_THLAR|nr:unnamed protein product [Thlaspi arvense]
MKNNGECQRKKSEDVKKLKWWNQVY